MAWEEEYIPQYEGDPSINQGGTYNAWLPTNPMQQQAGTAGGSSFSWGNSPWVPNVSNVPMDGGEFGFGAPNVRRVAGPSYLEDMVGARFASYGQPGGPGIMVGDWENAAPGMQHAMQGSMNMFNQGPNAYQRDAGRKYAASYGRAQGALDAAQRIASGPQAVGANISTDPALQAAQAAWAQTSKPMIQDQFSMMGLGRSGGAGQALANSWTQNATPFIQDSLAREQQNIDRRIQTQLAAAQGFQNQQGLAGGAQSIGDQWDARKAQALQNEMAANEQLMGRGDRVADREMQLMDAAMRYGGQFRGIADQANQAQYDDYLRRQGLAEQLLMGPMGMLQSSIGTSTNTSGGK